MARRGPRRAHLLGQPPDVVRGPLLVVDDEVGVLLGDDRATDPRALEPRLVDEPAGRIARRVPEDAPRRRQAERLVGLAPVTDLVEPLLDQLRVGRRQAEGRVDDDVRPWTAGRLEPALAVGEAEVGAGDDRLGAVAREDPRGVDDAGDLGLVRTGVRPDRAADRARDRQPEFEAGQPGPLGLGRGARHLDAGLGRVAVALGPRTLGPDLDDEAADAGVGDDEVAPPPEDEVRQLARPGEADERPQLVGVVGRGEQVGRATDPHRGEPRQRLVARGLDADPALDVGPGRDGVEGRDHASRPAGAPVDGGRVGERHARGRGEDQVGDGVGGTRDGRAPRAASAIRRGPGSSSSAAVEERSASNASSSTSAGGAGLDERRGVRPLVAGRMRVRHDDHRQPEGGRLGERGRTGPADDEVGRDQRREHLVAQERIRPVAVADGRRAAPRGRPAPPRTRRRR